MVLIPKRGYLLLLTGIIIGMLIFSAISMLYSRTTSTGTIKRIEIIFLYSSEKQSWLEEVIPQFEKEFFRKYGIEVDVKLQAAGTHETINMILQGSSRPTIWSPASSIWIPYLNEKWMEKHPGQTIAPGGKPLVISPIVIVGWKSLVEKHSIGGFMDLYRLHKKGINYKWGHPDPSYSNGGTMTVLLEFCEAANKTPDTLSIQDLQDEKVLEIVSSIESHAVMYGKSTGFFGSWAVDGGPEVISFFGVYESIVLDNALKAKHKWNDTLIAVYPSFGTLLSDHPFVILNASWITWYQKFAAEKLLEFLLRKDIQLRAEKHGFRPANPEVEVNPDIFNEKNGVSYTLNIRILKPPKGKVLEVMLKIWERVKNKGV
ncbi:MAG: substrate-binding domain-containing protein [Thermoproteales archaeon]|nr:substrate-binding domain-containing protein [Thermoproteales archaeon]